MVVSLEDRDADRIIKVLCAANATLERRVVDLQMKREPEQPAPLSDAVLKKLELELDANDTAMLVRVLRGVEVCLEQSREKLMKARQVAQARDCEHRRSEVNLLLQKLERSR